MANAFRLAARASMAPAKSWRSSGVQASTFTAADVGRFYSDWDAWTLSPDFEQRFQFRLVRARARDMAKNDAWIVGFLDELKNNVVGAQGIRLRGNLKNAVGQLVQKTNKAIETAWADWGRPQTASADGRESWIDLQGTIIQTIAIDGECFVRRLSGFENEYGYALQIVDADLVDETYNVPAGPGQNQIRMGIEVDRWGRAVAYHVWTSYAEDLTGRPRERERVPASEMLHLFHRWYRGNTIRGVSWFAPVITPARHLDRYEFNHLIASRVSAAKMAFIVNLSANAVEGYTPPKKGEARRTFQAEAGTIPELLPGQEIQTFDPSFPQVAYDQFVMGVLRKMARGLKISYVTLTGDLRQANYSSGRMGLQPERDHWRALHVWFAAQCHDVVYRDWIDIAALKGMVAVDNRLGSDYYAVTWHGRGWKAVDPINDLKAAKMEIDLGLNSRTRLNEERGQDYEDIVDELADEQDYAEENDVDVSGNQMTGVNPTSVSPEGAADESEEDGAPTKKNDSTPSGAKMSVVA